MRLELSPGSLNLLDLNPLIQKNILSAAEAGGELIVGKAQRSYLSGPRPERLGVGTGKLRSHVTSKVEPGGPGVFATIVVGVPLQNVPYAAIHEYGGQTSPHRIEARRVPFLVFFWEKKGIWMKIRGVNHPGSKIPPRPYLSYAAIMSQGKVKDLLQSAVDRAYIQHKGK